MVEESISVLIGKVENKMREKVEKYRKELTSLRTGRANPQLLDNVYVEYYGSKVPLKQVAAISVSQARTLEVRPWDLSVIDAVETELKKMDLGTAPVKDDKAIRINLPAMNQDQREKMGRIIRKMGEEAKINIRNERRRALDSLKKAQKKGEISEDELVRHEREVQKATDNFVREIDSVTKAKEDEILTV